MMDSIINLFFFRDLYTRKEKWFIAIFLYIFMLFRIMLGIFGAFVIGSLKVTAWFFSALARK